MDPRGRGRARLPPEGAPLGSARRVQGYPESPIKENMYIHIDIDTYIISFCKSCQGSLCNLRYSLVTPSWVLWVAGREAFQRSAVSFRRLREKGAGSARDQLRVRFRARSMFPWIAHATVAYRTRITNLC